MEGDAWESHLLESCLLALLANEDFFRLLPSLPPLPPSRLLCPRSASRATLLPSCLLACFSPPPPSVSSLFDFFLLPSLPSLSFLGGDREQCRDAKTICLHEKQKPPAGIEGNVEVRNVDGVEKSRRAWLLFALVLVSLIRINIRIILKITIMFMMERLRFKMFIMILKIMIRWNLQKPNNTQHCFRIKTCLKSFDM